MYAIIASGGKQYRVSEGERVRVEKLDGAIGTKVVFEKVLMVGDGVSVGVVGELFQQFAIHYNKFHFVLKILLK